MITTIEDPNIKLEPIEMTFRKDVPPDSVADYTQDIGKNPFVVFRGQVLEYKDIISLKVYSNKFFPSIEIIFKDPLGQYYDVLFPFDSDYISYFLKSRSPNSKSIRIDFTITNFTILKNHSGENEDKTYILKGRMRFNDIIVDSYFGTSYKVLSSLAKDAQLGYASNIDDTNDQMTWINHKQHISEFIPDITTYSYKDDDTFLWSYIDLNYYLTYVDIEKELNGDISEQKCVTSDLLASNEVVIAPLILTNDSDWNGSNLYINKFRLDNDSYDTNWNLGYNSYIYYYDKINKNLNTYILDTISTEGKDRNLIIQKGMPDDNKNQLENRRNYWIGKMDVDNVHPNYLYAYQQNLNNVKFLQKIRMNIVLRYMNFELRRYQLVEIILYNRDKIEGEIRDKSDNTDPISEQSGDKSGKINQRLSGQWLIVAINYVFDKQEGMRQEITVVKRELTAKYKNITQRK